MVKAFTNLPLTLPPPSLTPHPTFHLFHPAQTMPKCSLHRNYGKTSAAPRRPYEKERLDQEMKLLGEFNVPYGQGEREVGCVYQGLPRVPPTPPPLFSSIPGCCPPFLWVSHLLDVYCCALLPTPFPGVALKHKLALSRPLLPHHPTLLR